MLGYRCYKRMALAARWADWSAHTNRQTDWPTTITRWPRCVLGLKTRPGNEAMLYPSLAPHAESYMYACMCIYMCKVSLCIRFLFLLWVIVCPPVLFMYTCIIMHVYTCYNNCDYPSPSIIAPEAVQGRCQGVHWCQRWRQQVQEQDFQCSSL